MDNSISHENSLKIHEKFFYEILSQVSNSFDAYMSTCMQIFKIHRATEFHGIILSWLLGGISVGNLVGSLWISADYLAG